MTDYRRIYSPGASWFFTVNLAEGRENGFFVEHIDQLRTAFRAVKERKPYTMNAVVILPDHLHCIWTLPRHDGDFSTRWDQIKGNFSRQIDKARRALESPGKPREQRLWRRGFWAHVITDADDLKRHIDYIHWNPVKHGCVENVADWPYSSFHRFVEARVYPAAWAHTGEFGLDAGE